MNRKLWLEVNAGILLSLLLFKTGIGIHADAAALGTHGKSHFSSVIVVGRVFCDACFQRKFTSKSYFVPGAWVGVKCSNVKKHGGGGGKGQTDSHGLFRIELSFGSFRSEKEIERCTVHLLSSSSRVESCNVPFIKNRSHLSIKSKINDDYVYTVAPLTFRPPSLPPFCRTMSARLNSSKFDFPFPFPPIPPISFPLPPLLPPLFPPIWGLPPIPFWPPLPDIPILPPSPPLPLPPLPPSLPPLPLPPPSPPPPPLPLPLPPPPPPPPLLPLPLPSPPPLPPPPPPLSPPLLPLPLPPPAPSNAIGISPPLIPSYSPPPPPPPIVRYLSRPPSPAPS